MLFFDAHLIFVIILVCTKMAPEDGLKLNKYKTQCFARIPFSEGF